MWQWLNAFVWGVTWDCSNALVETCMFSWHPWWWKMRLGCMALYRGAGPVAVLEREMGAVDQRDPDLTYGETLPTSFVHMLRQLEVPAGSTVVDLGCGRALHLLTAARLLGVHVRGCDLVLPFVANAMVLARRLGLDRHASFRHGSFFDESLDDADVVHVSATTLSAETRQQLLEKFRELRMGTRLITQDWILPVEDATFTLLGSRPYPTSWGWTTTTFYRVS
jgi:hypothetical protein